MHANIKRTDSNRTSITEYNSLIPYRTCYSLESKNDKRETVLLAHASLTMYSFLFDAWRLYIEVFHWRTSMQEPYNPNRSWEQFMELWCVRSALHTTNEQSIVNVLQLCRPPTLQKQHKI